MHATGDYSITDRTKLISAARPNVNRTLQCIPEGQVLGPTTKNLVGLRGACGSRPFRTTAMSWWVIGRAEVADHRMAASAADLSHLAITTGVEDERAERLGDVR
ncbi:hypothetical protein GCM10009854_48880 [Saccharopolyspora halophila]|uniref:Uncharacterized protein n=1 Tax=Saccharopolyspora halophila TaxID=405551 RepID=A0ABN3GX78_9PSEU